MNVANKNKGSLTKQSVLIVGGGHVGLSFSLLLAHYGIHSTLLEKNSYPTTNPDDDSAHMHYLDSRNTALSRRTVQIYEEIGLWNKLQSHACRIDSVHISEQGSFGKAKLFKEEENVENFGQVIENSWLGRKLLLAVKESQFINIIDAATVNTLTQDSNSVTISYQQNNDDEVIENNLTADLLVACDGRDSKIRELLNIETYQYDYNQSGIVGVVTTDKPHNYAAIEKFSPAGPLALLPLTDSDGKGAENIQQGYRRSVVWVCPKGEESIYLNNDDYFLETLQKAFGTSAGSFIKAGKRGCYPLTKVLAKRQVDGRVVIMGNAAHTLHPVAGQGFNLCMRDAHVLSQLLFRQIARSTDIGNSQFLHNYETARLKDQKRVIKFCDAVVLGFTHSNPVVKIARNIGLNAFDKLPNIKPLIATYAMGLKS